MEKEQNTPISNIAEILPQLIDAINYRDQQKAKSSSCNWGYFGYNEEQRVKDFTRLLEVEIEKIVKNTISKILKESENND